MHTQGTNGSSQHRKQVGPARRRWLTGSVFLAAVVLLGWLGLFRDKTLRYSEEVQLATGDVIQIERVIKATPLGEIGGPGGWEVKFNSLRMTAGALVPPPSWENADGLVPLLFDRVGSDWFLVATFYTCEAWYDLGRPKLPYAEFRVVSGAWQPVPLAPELVGREANVLTEIPFDSKNHLLTVGQKRARNADPTIAPKYLKIVDHWTTGC